MNGCGVRRGFFVLRDCQEPAFSFCTQCGRAVCAAHMGEGMLCVECSAHSRENGDEEEDSSEDEWYGEDQAYAYRHDYYSQQHYSPVYAGGRHDSYYDEYDVRSFDEQDTDSFGDDEEGGAGLLDS